LTFNTTSLSLAQALRRNELLQRHPLRPAADPKRQLYVRPEVYDLLDGRLRGDFPAIETERLIGVFTAGHLLRVSRRKTSQRPDMEEIVGADEVWALCPRRPPPGWRLLGRWLDKGVFIVLRAWEKGALFPRYPEACKQVIDDWDELLPGVRPHTALEIEDYVGEVYRDVDQQER
jgi:hypothetical protein